MTLTTMPRDLALGWLRLYRSGVPPVPDSPPVLRELARRDEAGRRLLVRYVGRWCPCKGGRAYRVLDPELTP